MSLLGGVVSAILNLRSKTRFKVTARATNMVKIVTDSCSDLPYQLAKELDITVVPLSVRFGNIIFQDGVDLQSNDFYTRLMSATELPKTISPSPGDFGKAYECLGSDGSDVVSIHISGKLSGTYNSALVAAREVASKTRVEVIDSLTGSGGTGLIAVQAARFAKAGADMDAVKAKVYAAMSKVHFFGFVDNLKYLYKGGRLGRGSVFLGSLLQMKPLLYAKDGEIYPLERVRGRKKAMVRLVELSKAYRNIEDMVVMDATTPQDGDWLTTELSDLVAAEHFYRARIGPTIGTYLGPGTLAVGLIGEG